MDKPFRDVAFEAAALLDPDQPTAAMRLTGDLDRQPVDISATLRPPPAPAPTSILAATVGTARIEGALTIPAEGGAERAARRLGARPVAPRARCCSPSSAARSRPRSRSPLKARGRASAAPPHRRARAAT
jgi:hypothetical protein